MTYTPPGTYPCNGNGWVGFGHESLADRKTGMISVVEYKDQHRQAWSDFVATSSTATVAHEIGWREVISKSLGHSPRYLLAMRGPVVSGILPLFLVQTWWRSKYLISVPWLDYGGVCADDAESETALLDEAGRMATESGSQFMELRSVAAGSGRLETSDNRVTFLMRLSGDPDEIWRGLDGKLRNQIRKSQKSKLTTEIGGKDKLPGFYRVFCRNMRDLGTPVWSVELFDQILTCFPDSARIIHVKHNDQVIAGGLVLSFRDRLYVPSASAYRSSLRYCPNHALYWRLIEDGCKEGYDWFDFGRSAIDSNTYRFKKQWSREPTQLHWQYLLGQGQSIPAINPRNPKYRLFINAWRRLPLPLANFLGPRVIKNFP